MQPLSVCRGGPGWAWSSSLPLPSWLFPFCKARLKKRSSCPTLKEQSKLSLLYSLCGFNRVRDGNEGAIVIILIAVLCRQLIYFWWYSYLNVVTCHMQRSALGGVAAEHMGYGSRAKRHVSRIEEQLFAGFWAFHHFPEREIVFIWSFLSTIHVPRFLF